METSSIILVIFVLAMAAFVAWEMMLSPMARSTRELHELNKIWGHFNDRTRSIEEIRALLAEREWRFHGDKVELLRTFINHFDAHAK